VNQESNPMSENVASVYQAAMGVYATDLAEAQADYARAEMNGDLSSQVDASQRMADIRVRAQEFERMAQDHVRAYAPRRELTQEEIMAKPMHAMTQGDVLRVMNCTSKYCQEAPLSFDDPFVQAGAQWAAATRHQYGGR
jgi:hypothetical protein